MPLEYKINAVSPVSIYRFAFKYFTTFRCNFFVGKYLNYFEG